MADDGFVQVLEFTTDDIDQLQSIYQTWEWATEGRRTLSRLLLTRSHDDSSRYCAFAFFDSEASARETANLPEVAEFAFTHSHLVEGMAVRGVSILEDKTY